MRIDEFSNTAGIDGSISSTEMTQFLLFGFDITLAEPAIGATFTEEIVFNSLITKEISSNSLITKEISFNSPLGA